MNKSSYMETSPPDCWRCKHLCALAVDRSDNFRQCGNPKCPEYGKWTEPWIYQLSREREAELAGHPIEKKPCEFFDEAQSIVPFRGDYASTGFVAAWEESVRRLRESYQFDRERHSATSRTLPPPPPPKPPADIHPLGLPDEWFVRSYVRVYPDGKDTGTSL